MRLTTTAVRTPKAVETTVKLKRKNRKEMVLDRAVTVLSKDLVPLQFSLRQHAEFFKEMTYALFTELVEHVGLPVAIRIFTDFSREKAKLIQENFDWRITV